MYIDLSYYKKRYSEEKGRAFEFYCKDILQIQGFTELQVTSSSGDYGVDILGYYDGELYAIQCKYYESKVSNHAIEEVYSGGNYYGASRYVVMTNNTFTDAAKEQAGKLNVILLDKSYFEGNAYIPCKEVKLCTLYNLKAEVVMKKDYSMLEDLRYQDEKRVELPFLAVKNALAVFTDKTIIDLYYLYKDEYLISIETMLDFFVQNSILQVQAFGYYKYLEGKLYFYLDKIVIEGALRK